VIAAACWLSERQLPRDAVLLALVYAEVRRFLKKP
jgi:hypothetical protein